MRGIASIAWGAKSLSEPHGLLFKSGINGGNLEIKIRTRIVWIKIKKIDEKVAILTILSARIILKLSFINFYIIVNCI